MSNWLAGFWHVDQSASLVLRQCLFSLHDGASQLVPQDWSLGVELKGSALIPFFVLLTRRTRIPFLLAAAVALVLLFPNGHYYVSFIAGVILARCSASLPWVIRPRSLRFIASALLIGTLLYQATFIAAKHLGPSRSVASTAWLVSTLGCVLILIVCIQSKPLQSLLNHWLFIYLGKISYSVYLVQFVVILCVLPPFTHFLNTLGLVHTWVLLPVTFAASVAGTILLASASYRAVEIPAINLGHWLTRKVQERLGTVKLLSVRG